MKPKIAEIKKLCKYLYNKDYKLKRVPGIAVIITHNKHVLIEITLYNE